MATNSKSSKQRKIPKRFSTLLWLLLICVGTMVFIGMAACSSRDQTDGAASNPASSSANPPRTSGAPPRIVPAGPVKLSQEIRDTSVKTLDGDSLKLSDYANKVLVVNLWATWCGPCRSEMPDLVKINSEYKSRGVVVLGIATEYNEHRGQDYAKDFIRSNKINYKIIWDDGTLAGPLVRSVNGRNSIPQSFVISRDGKVVKHFTGYSALSTPTLMRQAVEEALNDKSKA